MKSLIQKSKQILTNQKGFFSVLFVILCLVGVVVFTTFADMNIQSYAIREIQGMMDTSGTNALRMVISSDLLKDEYLGVVGSGGAANEQMSKDTNTPIIGQLATQVINTYTSELMSYLGTNNYLNSISVITADVYFERSGHGMGSGKERPYVVLDSVVEITIKNTGTFDESHTYFNRQFNSVKDTGTSFTVTSATSPQPGFTQLVIRSVTKATYR